MRLSLTAILLSLAAATALADDPPLPPAPGPDQWLVDHVSHLFELPTDQQREIRSRIESEPDLPFLLASLLSHEDGQLRRTCLVLIRDYYGDQAVVAGVQTLLADELSNPTGGDPVIVGSCCEILADWPQWSSIPLLLDALRSEPADQAPGIVHRPMPLAQQSTTWREADMALRLVSGRWPLPEPVAPGRFEQKQGGPGERITQLTLLKSWIDWWSRLNLEKDSMPQLRVEMAWSQPLPPQVDENGESRPRGGYLASQCSLWVRPTASAQVTRIDGQSRRPEDPSWRWTARTRSVEERPLSAIQADAVRKVHGQLSADPPVSPVAIRRVQGVTGSWKGRLELIGENGSSVFVELTEIGDPVSTTPPPALSEALCELLDLMAQPQE